MNFHQIKDCLQCGKPFKIWGTQLICCSLRCKLIYLAEIIPNGCWLWLGDGRKAFGYGHIYWNNTYFYAHRAAYEAFIAPIPKGMLVCHSCDNPACINPSHLWVGTHQDNMRDMVKKGRNRRKSGGRSPLLGRPNLGTRKLTEHQAKEILISEEKPRVLARKYNISISNIWAIKKRITWRYL